MILNLYVLAFHPRLTESQIGRVVDCFDAGVSVNYPYLSSNDVSLAALNQRHTCYAAQWMRWCNVPYLPNREKIYLVGAKGPQGKEIPEVGELENAPRLTATQLDGRIIGYQYIKLQLLRGLRAFRPYHDSSNIIWRHPDPTIKGVSGAALSIRSDEGWGIIGFQSHETEHKHTPPLYDSHGKVVPTQYWKIAYQPPSQLVENFLPICPGTTIRRLDELWEGEMRKEEVGCEG